MQIKEQVDLTDFNSFGVHAIAAYFTEIQQPHDLNEAMAYASQHRLPTQILGGGSNILFLHDYPGLIVRLANRAVERLSAPGLLRVAAGENWHQLVINCMSEGLYGLENLALIPGTVGAAPIQNIGAYGVEIEQFIVEVEVFDTATGTVRRMHKADCEFSYRDSIFKHSRNLIVLSVTLQLLTQQSPQIGYQALRDAFPSGEVTAQQVFDTVCRIRSSKLPDPAILGNAGSFFKNPIVSKDKYQSLKQQVQDLPCYPTAEDELVKIPAAWLLDRLGWKGRQRGQAAVHTKHALVLVNLGAASGEDIYLLAQEMSSSILSNFGLSLDPEVKII